MKYANLMGLGLMIAALAATGCEKKAEPTKADIPKTDDKKGGGKADEHAPHGAGPNGGVVFDLGKYHAEFTVDHPKKECTVLFLSGDQKRATAMPVAAKEFTLTTKETKTKEARSFRP